MANRSPRTAKRRRAIGVVVGLATVIGGFRAWDAFRPFPAPTPGDAARGEAAFYESDLGSSQYSSVPRVLFDAIPEMFPELLPEGWEGVGLFWRTASHDEPPVGLVKAKLLGMEAYASNCALCHAGQFEGKVVAGMPNTGLDPQELTRVLKTAVESDKVTVDSIAAVAERRGHAVGPVDRLALRLFLNGARAAFAKMPAAAYGDGVGPGRSDALAGWKRMLGVEDGHAITWVDVPAVYNQAKKERTLYDGSITGDPAARIMLTELRKGRPPRDPLLHREVFDDLVAYMTTRLAPPPYPLPIDAPLAARGHEVFRDTCAKCHGTYGERPSYPNRRIDVAKVGTDPERALAMTDGVAKALEKHTYKSFLKVEPAPTYMPPALNGVYMTALYLHDGSVPTLWHMLQPPEQRPQVFYRRWNEFDAKRVGLVCDERQGDAGLECAPDSTQKKHDARTVYRFDTRTIGNHNTGHTFGTTLGDDEKWALVEYLKTL